MSITLSTQDKLTLWTAAHGAISLISAAGAPSAHKAATNGSIALSSATGAVGHVLAERPKGMKLTGKSVAGIADQVLPALTAAVALLEQQDPAEADNFRRTVLIAVEASTQAHKAQPGPALAEMTRKISAALDA
ncbi:hypothetical protein AB0H76_07060 [Nocardia sp. NPDC050712]|uniref:hypothetical protein n=1 Tax=Nocardia sp. NPDC050712 TaxID=3155518 RepID=UPI0033FE512E